MSCLILFPTQLFDYKYIKDMFENVESNIYIILWEHNYFFKLFKFHKLKIAFFRATMRYYYDNLKTKHKLYINSIMDKEEQYRHIKDFIKDNKIGQLYFFDPIEKVMVNKISKKNIIPKLNIEYFIYTTPYFLNSSDFDRNTNIINSLKSINHLSFYKKQRIDYNIMVTNKNNKWIPDGNVWTFDTQNRSPFEKTQKDVELLKVNKEEKAYVEEAINYANTHYKNNYGTCTIDNFIYPISRKDSLKWLSHFINKKLKYFGKFEDAISSKIIFGYHSILSPILNIGLIVPMDIIHVIKNIDKKLNIDMSSKEGFIRQFIGWREYCYLIYDKYYDNIIDDTFYKKSTKNIPAKFWSHKTNIPFIDHILTNIDKYAYSHHIERLMCIGNFLILIDVSPLEIYKWFSTMYIDAYDVFMIPNVYGMLLYGKIDEQIHMMKRPYFCSSNYVLKMSDFKEGHQKSMETGSITYCEEWTKILDALYYRLVNNYSKEFSKIYSTANAVKTFNAFSANKKKDLLSCANNYLKWLYS